MTNTKNLSMIFHRIRVKLYPSYLPNVEGAYVAKTNNEKTLTIEDVCTILKTRAGFTGKYEDLLQNLKQYYDEVVYQLCDGYAVTNGYYTIHPNIGGTFNSATETHDIEKHPIDFRFGTRAKLRNMARNISVDIEGIADCSGYIDMFTDYEQDSTNESFTPGNQFAIHGHKIKLAGDEPDIGVYFVPVDDPTQAVKVERIAENNPSKITGIIPVTQHQFNRIEIRTRFSGSGSIKLKAPRTITSSFVIEAA